MVPRKLRPEVLAAAHEGHPGREGLLRLLRQSVWWPGLTQDVKSYTESCVGCAAALPATTTPPMEVRDTPERVWSELAADFKGPIGGTGGYYFHVLIDQFSRWPEVEMVKSTSWR